MPGPMPAAGCRYRRAALKAACLIALLHCQVEAAAQQSEWALPQQAVLFAPGSARLSAAARARLDTLGMRMRAMPDFPVVIEGNAANTPAGLCLSYRRVSAAIAYLVTSCDIDRARLQHRYRGAALDNQVFYRQPFAYEYREDGRWAEKTPRCAEMRYNKLLKHKASSHWKHKPRP